MNFPRVSGLKLGKLEVEEKPEEPAKVVLKVMGETNHKESE
jgi:hypothetical protein